MVRHKETESESEGAAHTEEPHFRIAVCMKHFYKDHRARALLYVSARRRVRWLQRRLTRLFALPAALVLLCRGHLLPRDEPLALLDRDDLVEVVPAPAEPDVAATTRGDAASDTVLPAAAAEPDPPSSPAAAAEAPDRPPSPPAAAEEPERPSSPARPDDLLESKRRALLVLDQFLGGEETSQAEPSLRVKRRRVRRRRRAPAAAPAPAPADDEHSVESAGGAGGAGGGRVFREPQPTAAVLRNHLLPRAPRLVRDVSRSNTNVLTCDVLPNNLTRDDVTMDDVTLGDVPRDGVSRCDLSLNEISLSPVAHVMTKIIS